jgi:hypothetical protein
MVAAHHQELVVEHCSICIEGEVWVLRDQAKPLPAVSCQLCHRMDCKKREKVVGCFVGGGAWIAGVRRKRKMDHCEEAEAGGGD